ncbi:MAG: hypothetical protein AUI10_08225 [Actinobacteria bacterium 13_2_20CM_2_72_6]|nr:MAG: hypothetical protein AUI10_08225 [Actinobacteria bacterium 13_2_20CM_2_72_6]
MTFPTADRPPYPEQTAPDAPAYPPAPRRSWVPEALVGLGVAVLVAGMGLGLGLLWWKIAPHPTKFIPYDGPAIWARPMDEYVVADENIYLFIMIGTGLVLAVLAWVLLRPFRGPIMLLALAVGGVGAGVLAYVTGYRIGNEHARYLLFHSPPGTYVKMPVDLRAQQVGLWHGWLPFARGDVLTLAVTAVLIYLLLAGFSAYPSLRPPRKGQVSSG